MTDLTKLNDRQLVMEAVFKEFHDNDAELLLASQYETELLRRLNANPVKPDDTIVERSFVTEALREMRENKIRREFIESLKVLVNMVKEYDAAMEATNDKPGS